MTIHYAADRSPPAAKLVAFTVRAARDEFVREDPAHRERVTAKAAAHLCKQWHAMGLAEAIAKGVV